MVELSADQVTNAKESPGNTMEIALDGTTIIDKYKNSCRQIGQAAEMPESACANLALLNINSKETDFLTSLHHVRSGIEAVRVSDGFLLIKIPVILSKANV